MWQMSRLTVRSQIQAYLESDRLYAAYAIGDLEPGMYEQCTWVGARRAAGIEALALRFDGFDPAVLFVMGSAGGLRAVLANGLCPSHAYATCLAERLAVMNDFYEWQAQFPMWRLVVRPQSFRPSDLLLTEGGVLGGVCLPLAPDQAGDLARLYALGGGGHFSSEQVELGVFYGVWLGDHLVAAAGTHLVSLTYGVGAVGNVFTHPDYRGRGYATAATSAVVAELLKRGVRDVVLNVGQENRVAMRVYERLGFERYCPFYEGPVSRRGVAPPAS